MLIAMAEWEGVGDEVARGLTEVGVAAAKPFLLFTLAPEKQEDRIGSSKAVTRERNIQKYRK